MINHKTVADIAFAIGSLSACGCVAAGGYLLTFAQMGRASRPSDNAATAREQCSMRFLLLIPAHNEEQGITSTLASVAALDYPQELLEIVVIADNCTDETEAAVHRCGVTCWRRTDELNRGKGQAIEWALDRAATKDWNAVVIVDADTYVDPLLLRAFDSALKGRLAVTQATYELRAQGETFARATSVGKFSENWLFARPRSWHELFVPIHGNGFCIPRDVLRSVPWKAKSVAEDLQFAIELLRRGMFVAYAPAGKVTSSCAPNLQAAGKQRIRWASGTFGLFRALPELFIDAVRMRDWRIAEGAVALLLSSRMFIVYWFVLALLCCGLLLKSVLGAVVGLLLIFSLLINAVYLAVVLKAAKRQRGASGRELALYALWLAGTQAKAILHIRKREWVRTPRDTR